MIGALRSVVVLFATPLITRFADRSGKRVRTLTLILLFTSLGFLLYMLPNSFPGFLAVALIFSLFSSGMMPIGDGVIVRMAKRHNLQFGQLRMWGSIGWVIFGILGGLLWQEIGYRYLYWVSSGLILVVALLSTRLEEPQAEADAPANQTTQPERSSLFSAFKDFQLVWKDWVLLLFLLACLFRSAGELMFHSYSALYINELTHSAFFVGLLRGGAALLEIFIMLFLQKLILRFGQERVIMSGFFVQALGIGIFAFFANPWIMYVGTLLRSAGYALFFIAAVQFIDERAGAQNAASYQGLMSIMGSGLAPLLFTPLAGWVYQRFSGQSVFILAMGAAVVASLVFLPILVRSRKNSTPPTAAAPPA